MSNTDGGPAFPHDKVIISSISDDHALAICETIKRGYGTGAFPMIEGKMVGWADWLRHMLAARGGGE